MAVVGILTWAARWALTGVGIVLSDVVFRSLESGLSAAKGVGLLIGMKADPELTTAAIERLNTQVVGLTPIAAELAASTMNQMAGLGVSKGTLLDIANQPPGRTQAVAIGDAFLPTLNTIFDVAAAIDDFKTRTGTAGSFTNMSAYFGTNLIFQLRSLTISTIATMFGWHSLRHLEGLHQSINWAFGFGWLSWTIMSTLMETTVLPGVRRGLLAQVKPNDLTEAGAYDAHLSGLIERELFDQIMDTYGQRSDVRDVLLDIRERALTETNLRTLFQEGQVDEPDVKAQFRIQGFRDERAQLKTNLIVDDRKLDILGRMTEYQGRLYRDNLITENELRAWLDGRNYTDLEKDLYVSEQELDRKQRRWLTVNDLAGAMALGIFDALSAVEYLVLQGFTEEDATTTLLLQLQPDPLKSKDLTSEIARLIRELAGLVPGAPETSIPGLAPTIEFDIVPVAILSTDIASLIWRTENATRVTINRGIGDVPLSGEWVVDPKQTTSYTLTATGPDGKTTAFAVINVTEVEEPEEPELPPPVISSFSVAAAAIIEGESTTLAWQTTGADRVILSRGIGDVDLTGSWVVSPTVTTSYTLSARNAGGVANAFVVINVTPLPEEEEVVEPEIPVPVISSFTAEPAIAVAGGRVTLSWATIGADRVVINRGIGDQPTTGEWVVFPQASTSYTLTAINEGGPVTAFVRVTARPRIQLVVPPLPAVPLLPPRIDLFSVGPATVTRGQTTTVGWQVSNAARVQISEGIGDVAPSGQISVPVNRDMAITITASNVAGSERQTIQVAAVEEVLPPPPPLPRIISFGSEVTLINLGQQTNLVWATENADRVVINRGIGDVPLSGAWQIGPRSTTSYTLFASGPGGTVTAFTVVEVIPLPPVR